MSILDHLDASHRPDDDIPRFKSNCCMKYSVDTQCKRCPFRQITDVKAQDQAKSECWDKRRGSYKWYNEKEDVEVIVEYNNQYR